MERRLRLCAVGKFHLLFSDSPPFYGSRDSKGGIENMPVACFPAVGESMERRLRLCAVGKFHLPVPPPLALFRFLCYNIYKGR